MSSSAPSKEKYKALLSSASKTAGCDNVSGIMRDRLQQICFFLCQKKEEENTCRCSINRYKNNDIVGIPRIIYSIYQFLMLFRLVVVL